MDALGFTPAIGDHALTGQQQSLIALAHHLGREKFAPRAAGLLRLCVPEGHGGLGADYATYMMVAAELGRFCGATALTYNRHICSTRLRAILEARPHPPKDERLRLYAAQYTVMEGGNDIARRALRTCGGQSMMKHLPLERLYRDSRCGSLMLQWMAELVLDRMGREALYEPGEKDE